MHRQPAKVLKMRLALLGLVCGCNGGIEVDTDTGLDVPILEGPVIEHTPPEGPFLEGQMVAFEATATDEDGVDTIDLFTRISGDLPFRITPMTLSEDGVFEAEIMGDLVAAPGVEYYLRAFDRSDFRVPSDFPFSGPDTPIALEVAVVPLGVPYTQGFDETTTSFGVYEVGWTEHALAFRGDRWDVDPVRGQTGGAAVHQEGYPGMEAVDDWLVGPVLDFSGLTSAEVRFLQYGERTEHIEGHGLYVSTGDADPEAGEFVEVAVLPDPAESSWSRAPVVDLSAYAGEPRVVLAWRYQGTHADVWALDDIRVREFGPDLQLVAVSEPALTPGGAGLLDVTLVNAGAPTEGGVVVDPIEQSAAQGVAG